MDLFYHKKTFEMLGLNAQFSKQRAEKIANVERKMGFKLPLSISEFLTIQSIDEIFERNSGLFYLVDLENLGGFLDPHEFVQNWVCFAADLGGVFYCMVKIDSDSEDPSVWHTTGWVNDHELLGDIGNLSNSFSAFIFDSMSTFSFNDKNNQRCSIEVKASLPNNKILKGIQRVLHEGVHSKVLIESLENFDTSGKPNYVTKNRETPLPNLRYFNNNGCLKIRFLNDFEAVYAIESRTPQNFKVILDLINDVPGLHEALKKELRDWPLMFQSGKSKMVADIILDFDLLPKNSLI